MGWLDDDGDDEYSVVLLVLLLTTRAMRVAMETMMAMGTTLPTMVVACAR